MIDGIIHVLVVDDRALVRELIAHRLASEPDLRVEEVRTVEACLEAVRRRAPDVILLNTMLGGLAAFYTSRAVADVDPTIPVVYLSHGLSDRQIEQAVEAGARGLLCEQDSVDELLRILRSVAGGGTEFSSHIRARLEQGPSENARASGPTPLSCLSQREREVIVRVAEGLSSKEIGRVMHLSAKTVETHIWRVMQKLGLRERVSLTRYAIREGLVEP